MGILEMPAEEIPVDRLLVKKMVNRVINTHMVDN